MRTAADFLELNGPELREALASGHPVEGRDLQERVYRGVSLGLPGFVDRLAWKTFAKVFHRDSRKQALRGWNLRLEQTGLSGPLLPKKKNGGDFHFGHFQVESGGRYSMPRALPDCLVLDYGKGGNPRLDGTRLVRDPIVAVNPGCADLLLGWTYLDLGMFQLGTPSYFTLELVKPLNPDKIMEPAGAPSP